MFANVQEDQKKEILAAVTNSSVEKPTVLRLKLVLDIATKLMSYEKLGDVPFSVRGLIDRYVFNKVLYIISVT